MVEGGVIIMGLYCASVASYFAERVLAYTAVESAICMVLCS